jgi:GTP-binding protein
MNTKAINNFFQNKMAFFGSYFNTEQLPQNINSTEIAVLGRSNVGKSSLINALGLNNNLAFTSKKPGCTVSINFYKIQNHKNPLPIFLVDLPGYGYAKRSANDIKKITFLITNYLINRTELKKVYLLIDSRVGIQPVDGEFINFFNQHNIQYQIVLTKIDKASKSELIKLEYLIESFFQHFINVDKTILKVSSKNSLNLESLRCSIMNCFINLRFRFLFCV